MRSQTRMVLLLHGYSNILFETLGDFACSLSSLQSETTRRKYFMTLGTPIRLSDLRECRHFCVSFNKNELRQLLNIYSRRVAAGEWRDYAIDLQKGSATFSIFRSTYDKPLFSIFKHRRGPRSYYTVFEGPQKLKHGKNINEVLSVFDTKPYLVFRSR